MSLALAIVDKVLSWMVSGAASLAILSLGACTQASEMATGTRESNAGSTSLATEGGASYVPSPLPVTVGEIRAVPRWNQWSLLDPDQRTTLRARVAAAKPSTWRRMVAEGDAMARGLGLFFADQHGDVAGLLSWCALLEDHRETLPYPLPTAWAGPMQRHTQTVSGYLSTLYQVWFGVDVDGNSARCEAYLGQVGDPADPVLPWVVRLLRAGGGAEVRRIQRALTRLSAPRRAVVILLGFEHGVLGPGEACEAWHAVSRDLREALNEGVPLLPDEPMALAYGQRFQRRLAGLAARLNGCFRGAGP